MSTASVTIRLTPADYASTERHVCQSLHREGRWYWPVRALGVVVGSLLLVGLLCLWFYEPRHGTATLVRASVLMFFAAIVLSVVATNLHKQSVAGVLFAHGSKLLEPFTLGVTEKGLDVQSPAASATLQWTALRRVELKGDLLFIFTQPNSALAVPARAFASRAEFESFGQVLARGLNEHKR